MKPERGLIRFWFQLTIYLSPSLSCDFLIKTLLWRSVGAHAVHNVSDPKQVRLLPGKNHNSRQHRSTLDIKRKYDRSSLLFPPSRGPLSFHFSCLDIVHYVTRRRVRCHNQVSFFFISVPTRDKSREWFLLTYIKHKTERSRNKSNASSVREKVNLSIFIRRLLRLVRGGEAKMAIFFLRCLSPSFKIAQYIPSAHGDGWKPFLLQCQIRLISFLQSDLSLLHPEISFSSNILNGLTVGQYWKQEKIYHASIPLITRYLRAKMKNGSRNVDRKGRRTSYWTSKSLRKQALKSF